MNNISVEYLKIKSSTFNKITNYLAKKPYGEVSKLFDEIRTSVTVDLGDTNVSKETKKEDQKQEKK